MLKNFIIITLRSLRIHKVYTLVNILGLAVGMACAILISIYVLHELSYDKFHVNADNLYRVTVDGSLRGRDLKTAVTSSSMAKVLTEEFPQIKASTRVGRFGAWLVSIGDTRYNEDNFLFADPNFFSLFSFRFIEGNPDSALVKPRSIVLTESAAIRYFGDDNPVGKQLMVETEDKPFTVTGLIEDVPSNSHMQFDIIGSLVTLEKYLKYIWVSHDLYTYILTEDNVRGSDLDKEIDMLVEKYVSPQIEKYLGISFNSFLEGDNSLEYKLQPIKKIHLYSDLDIELEPNGNALYVYAFGIFALLILVIACLNFMNLSTANSSNRAREVVLRKVVGSERRMLIFQFLTESVLFSFFALVLAFLLVEILMPYFNRYLNLELQFQVLKNIPAISLILFFTFVLGLLAGSYPALFISSYEPVKVLHGILNKGLKNQRVRSVFVVFQFFVSVLIIIMALVVFAQLEFMLNKELGFVKERVLVIRRPDALKKRIDNFREEIVRHPNIESVTNSNSIPGRNFLSSTYMIEGDSSQQNYLMNQLFVSYDFREALGLRMVEGRFFSPSIASDSFACVINETAFGEMRNINPIGKHLIMPGYSKHMERRFKIIGVVKDFHFETVDKQIEPLVISLMPGNWEGYLNVRLSSKGIDKSINYIESTWEKYTSEYPFQSFFLDEDFDKNYRSVVRTGRVLFIFALLSIFVACLGLFGLVSFTTNQRIFEIGVRKSMGATYYQIIFLLLKEILTLIFIAIIIAWTTAYVFSKFWLKDFYARITLTPNYFFMAALIVLSLSVLVVLYQCYTASRSEPSTALKTE